MKPGRDPAALQRRFNDEAKCLAFLERARWPRGPECPACGVVDHASRITTRPGDFTCLSCKRRFSVTAGTPMHRTHLPLCTWIIACHLLATSSKGISSLKLASLLGLQYRTSWHLTRRIRAMMDDAPDLMRAIVELDETSMGGKPRARNRPSPSAPVSDPPPLPPKKGKKRRKAGRGTEKPMAFTIAQRGGKTRLVPIMWHSTADFWPLVRDRVHPCAVRATDELSAYISIGALYGGHTGRPFRRKVLT